MTPSSRSLGWRWWAAVLGAAAVLRAVVALGLLGSMPMVSDAHDYLALALRLTEGDAAGAFYWPPGESAALATAFLVFGKSLVVARCLTIAMSTVTVALTALIARELAGDRVARIAGWIAAFYAPAVLLCGQAYAQHLAALCLAALAYFGLRALRERRVTLFLAAGLAAGVGCLTRPSMASVAPVLIVAWAAQALAWRRERGAGRSLRALGVGAAAMACATLVLVAPVLVHNARAGGGWTVSTNNERNLFLGNNPFTPDYKTSHLGQRSLDEIDPDAREYLESFYDRTDARAAMKQAAVEYIVTHPLHTALRTLNRSTSFWGFDYIASREIQKWRGWGSRSTLPILALEAGSYLAIGALALVALFALAALAAFGKRRKEPGEVPAAYDGAWRTWLVALALAYEIPYAIAFSGGAYHFPVLPLLIPLAAVAIARPGFTWSRLRRSAPAWAALALFAAVQAQYAYNAWAMSG